MKTAAVTVAARITLDLTAGTELIGLGLCVDKLSGWSVEGIVRVGVVSFRYCNVVWCGRVCRPSDWYSVTFGELLLE